MMVNNYKIKDNIFNIKKSSIFIVGILSSILTIDFNAHSGYEWQFLLPLLFSLAYFLFAPPIRKFGMGYLVLNVVWIVRYCINPMFIKLSNYQIRYYGSVSDRDLHIALFLMLIEFLISIISCKYFFGKYNRSNIIYNNSVDVYCEPNLHNDARIKRTSLTIILFMVVVSIVVLVMDPYAIKSFNFIFSAVNTSKGNANFETSVLIINWTKIVFTVFLIEKFAKRERLKNNQFNVIISIIAVIVSISFFSGTSRNSILIEALSYIYLLLKFFPKYKKHIFIICIGALCAILLSITMVRFYDTRNISEGLSNYDITSVARMLNAYFAGQQNVAIGVNSIVYYWDNYNILTIFKDLLANTILLNKLVMNIPGTVEIYNAALYGHTLWADQIPPTITQAIALFSVLGFFVPTFIIYFILKMDRISEKSSKTFEVFIASFIAINLAFFSPGNITILSTALTNRFIPLYLIYKLSLIQSK